jgi:hypothetical protein
MVSVTPRSLYPRQRGLGSIVQEVGWALRAGLDGCGKSCTLPGYDPRTAQPVASRYTDWAVPVHLIKSKRNLSLLRCSNSNLKFTKLLILHKHNGQCKGHGWGQTVFSEVSTRIHSIYTRENGPHALHALCISWLLPYGYSLVTLPLIFFPLILNSENRYWEIVQKIPADTENP